MFEDGYYIVVIDKKLSSCSEVSGPYYESQESEIIYYNEVQKDKVCLAVMPDGISNAGGDYRYIIPENQEEWTCMTDQGFLVHFEKRTNIEDAKEFYAACLNEANKYGIMNPMRPEDFKNLTAVKFVTEDGTTRIIYLATDSCDTWLSSGVYYQNPGFENIEELQSYFINHGIKE